MERNRNLNMGRLAPAVCFIKSRKLDSIVMDMAAMIIKEAATLGYEIIETELDRAGSRDIDRQQMDRLYVWMEKPEIHDIFIRRFDDISGTKEDQLAFLRFASDHNVKIHVLDVTLQPEIEAGDGGIGC